MEVSKIGSLSSGGGTSTTGVAPKTSKDEFLKLLVAQLQNQDPLEPQKGSEFVAQLAQFASLEQSAATNSLLGEIQLGQSSQARSGLTSLIGHTVTAKSKTLDVGPQGPSAMSVNLDAPAGSVKVIVRDAAGKEVRTLALGPRPAGATQIDWAAAGAPLPPGSYKVDVTATGEQGADVPNWTQIKSTVSSVEFLRDGTQLIHLGSTKIQPGEIISVE